MDKKQTLQDIFNNDPFGLLTLKPKVNHRNSDERLAANFQQIVDFMKKTAESQS